MYTEEREGCRLKCDQYQKPTPDLKTLIANTIMSKVYEYFQSLETIFHRKASWSLLHRLFHGWP